MSIEQQFAYMIPSRDEVIADIKRRMANSQTVTEDEIFMMREHVRKMNKPMFGTKETI